jgi:acetyl-CoA carboxylase biotin carboxyl carrier protein
VAAAVTPANPQAVPKNEPAAAPAKKLVEIKSPTPGTFYASSSPDAQPFVRVGSKVTPTTVVCLIEAMKIFNEITADCTGAIAEILAENQQPVEYGQVLFRVDPAG